MSDASSDKVRELIGLIGEFFAVIHYFSDLIAALYACNFIFENDSLGLVFAWFVVGLVSAIVAELLKSKLPTPLRIFLKGL